MSLEATKPIFIPLRSEYFVETRVYEYRDAPEEIQTIFTWPTYIAIRLDVHR